MISRDAILDLFREALTSVAPRNLIPSAVTLDRDRILIGGKAYSLPAGRGIHVFGSGKASIESARAIEAILGDRIVDGLVVSNYPDEGLERIDVFQSSHPLPTEKSVRAANLLMKRLSALSEDDFFIYILSGGSSALVEKPVPPVSLKALQETVQLLLKNNVPIEDMNRVRKHLSLVKGGRLGRLTRAKGVVLVISDVIGDELDTIGSAPLLYDRSSYETVREILHRNGLWNLLPSTVKSLIGKGLAGTSAETPKDGNPNIDHVVIGSNVKLLERGKDRAERLGLEAHIMSSRLRGEAKEAAKAIVSIGEEIAATGHPYPPPVCLLFGGETTVTVRGTGKGGRNQEMCLAALKEIRTNRRLTFLSAGTDGVDGSSDAAGAVVDSGSFERAGRLGLNIDDYLERNDSHEFFRQTGDLIMTGPTGTNVMDMMILAVDKEDR